MGGGNPPKHVPFEGDIIGASHAAPIAAFIFKQTPTLSAGIASSAPKANFGSSSHLPVPQSESAQQYRAHVFDPGWHLSPGPQ